MSQAGSTLPGGGGGGGGNVSGPGVSVVGDIATWNNVTGTLLADSGVAFPIPVASGGTGDTSTTAYAVICGGTTSTAALQSIASVGTSGQILTSNGAGALPTFQAPATSGTVTSVSVVSANGFAGTVATATTTPAITLTTTQTGVLSGNGTAITGTAVTQHDVIVGGASNALTSVAPSATSGVPLISQGAAADPAFGTAVVAGGGTGATTLTNHGVLIGQGTSAVTATAAGTSGQVLQSGGGAANPAYSTATYPATATGTGSILRADGTNWAATTATYPNTVTQANFLYGSASNVVSGLAPSAFPNIGGFPTYDETNGVWFNPAAYLFEWDDFIAAEDNTSFSKLSWNRMAVNSGTISMATTAQDSARPGVVSLNMATNAGSAAGIILGANPNSPIIFGGARYIFNFWVKTPNVSDATDTYTLLIGLNSNTVGGTGNNALIFSLNSGVNSGNWQMIAVKSGGGTTTASSSTGTDANWHQYTIDVNAAATSAAFYIDNVQLGNSPVTTNIPTTASSPVGPAISILRTAGSTNTRSAQVDLFTMWAALTTPR